jgi:CheY-like chemotaxis protein
MPTRVLVVDDDPVVCELIQEVLESAEMETTTTTNSRQAATSLDLEKFQVVFVDMNMPHPNGVELTRHIRASSLNQTALIVMITAENDRAILGKAFQAGVNFLLYKPLDRHGILRLMRVADGAIQRELRRFQRVKVSCKVSVESKQGQLNGTTLDISMGGMFVQTSQGLPVGSSVHVRLELKPGAPALNLAARVARVVGTDCLGLQLDDNGPGAAKRLQEFLLPLILATTTDEPNPRKNAKINKVASNR